MSRGLGRLQREIITALDALGGEASTLATAERVYGEPLTTGSARYGMVSRAMRSLRRRGSVRKFCGPGSRVWIDRGDGRGVWHDVYALPTRFEQRMREVQAELSALSHQ